MITRRSLLLLPLGAALAGCGASTSPDGTGPGGPPSGAPLKVGLLINGTLTDSGWNALAGKGLDEIKAQLGAQTSHQSAGSAQAEEALRGFARDGYALVFAHGNEFGDAAKRVAQEYPKTDFVVSSGEVEAPNVASLKFDLGEASYLAGI
ncbi:MAG TPA: BMP family ABC transporter substrate-binding protein, partial [Armatimonadota bacterium]|nr:BMP family ABC transporter substrate-binding protein [Armatimonadota bacterium]